MFVLYIISLKPENFEIAYFWIFLVSSIKYHIDELRKVFHWLLFEWLFIPPVLDFSFISNFYCIYSSTHGKLMVSIVIKKRECVCGRVSCGTNDRRINANLVVFLCLSIMKKMTSIEQQPIFIIANVCNVILKSAPEAQFASN